MYAEVYFGSMNEAACNSCGMGLRLYTEIYFGSMNEKDGGGNSLY